jgi:hypothetical protein
MKLPDPPGPPLWRTYALAMRVLTYFLGIGWMETNVMNKTAPTDFLRNDWSSPERRDFHFYRVISLAEMIFNLQWVGGFDNLVDDVRTNTQLEPRFAELEVGKLLHIYGVNFRFIVPQGTKGTDYDIELCMPDGRVALVETECKIETTAISSRTMKDTLEHARKQLPKDGVGIIFVRVPGDWFKVANEWLPNKFGAETVSKAIQSFLRNTTRIVSVKAYGTAIHLEDGFGVQLSEIREFDNDRTGGKWSIFENGPAFGTGPSWVDFISIVSPLPSFTHPTIL